MMQFSAITLYKGAVVTQLCPAAVTDQVDDLQRANVLHRMGWLFVPCALMLVGPAFANSLQEIKAKWQIRVAMYKNFPPFSVNVEGIDVDIATALAEKLSVKLDLMWFEADENVDDDLRNVVWKGHYLGGGTADLMMHVPADSELARRNDEVAIIAPYYREEIKIARNVNRIPALQSLEIFTTERIGVELETASDAFLLTSREAGYGTMSSISKQPQKRWQH
jgi:ABC-type amino acid transport substrate-binding protein